VRGTIGTLLLRLARDAGLHGRLGYSWLTALVTGGKACYRLFFKARFQREIVGAVVCRPRVILL
jgi:hypothetical protein